MAKAVDTSGMWEYKTLHRIVYNTENPVPIKDVIAALQGLEGILGTVPAVVAGFTGVEITHSEFSLHALESGSLIEDVFVTFFFDDKAKFDEFIKKAAGIKMVRGTVVGLAIAGVVGYGLHYATSTKPTPNITANNNVIINIGAGELQASPEAIKAIVQSAIQSSGKKEIATDAIKFLAPARNDPKSSVSIGTENETKFEFKSAAIAEAPTSYDGAKNERTEDLQRVEVQIRATDRDSKKSGWAGKVPGRDNRMPIELDPQVNDSEIFGRESVMADVTLIFAPRGKGQELKPVKIYIRRIHKI